MVYIIKKKSLLTSDCEILVNAVNCIGIMGKGIAKDFKQLYPEYFHDYKNKCNQGKIQLGKVDLYLFENNPNRYICSFPTIHKLYEPSNLENIKLGLMDLKLKTDRLGIKTIALSAVGCGNGGLNIKDVYNLVVSIFDKGTIEFYDYEDLLTL
ncbi:MAG: hypothetical protein E6R13_09040 [Spirochaetes bacterium]|nr:MAG: hypothetical protein E6R13_09040 [Spirochaetota bacterium]